MKERRGRAWHPALAVLLGVCLVGCADDPSAPPVDPDARLRILLDSAHVSALAPAPTFPAPLVLLGQMLFFDKELSGNRDIACSTCHNPVYHTQDALQLSIGTGGHHPGPARTLGPGAHFVSRQSTDLFNHGYPQWSSMFWDGRVEFGPGGIETPANVVLPPGVASLLAAQAMLPVTDRIEMRGQLGDTSRAGQHNELADISDDDLPGIWRALTARLVANPEYRDLFAAAYPGVAPDALGFEHAAGAIGAFVASRWAFPDTPLDAYLRGELSALSEEEKRGALLFFGTARCGQCHNGPLLTDLKFHDVGVPDFGPGFQGGADMGRYRVTGQPGDRFAFRTPSLRNIALTAPYMHNGAFRTLDRVLQHYLNVEQSLDGFTASDLDPRLSTTLRADQSTRDAIRSNLDPLVRVPLDLTAGEQQDILAFLVALMDPAARVRLIDIPVRVPSGIPVFDF